MSKHTPGPWNIEFRPEHWERRWEISESDGACICVGDDWETPFRSEGDANARLISAAPDLLEACQTFAEWLRREDEGLPAGIVRDTPEGEQQWRIWWGENLRICNLAQERAHAAIAKAMGES